MSLIFLRIYILSNWSSAVPYIKNKIQTTNASTESGTQQSISIVNEQDETGMNWKRPPLFCCRLNWLHLSSLQLAYAEKKSMREVKKVLIGGWRGLYPK
jgi:hypothetical protein